MAPRAPTPSPQPSPSDPSPAPPRASEPSGPPFAASRATASAGSAWTGYGPVATEPSATSGRRSLAARPERTPGRVAVRLDFILPAAQRLYLVVRGPAPSCRVVGVVPIRGRAGENTVRFAGRVQDRRLEPGVYLLTLSETRRVAPGSEAEAVRVVSPRRTTPLPESERRPTCEAAIRDSGARAHLLSREAAPPDRAAAGPEARPVAPLRPPVNVPAVAGPAGSLPVTIVADAATSALELLLTFGVFALVGMILLVLLALATRYINGPRST